MDKKKIVIFGATGSTGIYLTDYLCENLDKSEFEVIAVGRRKTDYFVLRVSGDSMFPLYQDGDLVLVLKKDVTEYSGQIAVVLYDDDMATLKRVEYSPEKNWLNLVPVNPQFTPISINGEALNHCHILGIPRMIIRYNDGNM